jgi:hypothetical protein
MTKVVERKLLKTGYSYQFRVPDHPGFFRYDDTPHGRPEPYHHEHEHGMSIQPAAGPPSLFDFLREVEAVIAAE